MPWKECNRMDERLRFVARLLDGEKMAVACREFGISRKTGYKIFNRYKEFGVRVLEYRSRWNSAKGGELPPLAWRCTGRAERRPDAPVYPFDAPHSSRRRGVRARWPWRRVPRDTRRPETPQPQANSMNSMLNAVNGVFGSSGGNFDRSASPAGRINEGVYSQ